MPEEVLTADWAVRLERSLVDSLKPIGDAFREVGEAFCKFSRHMMLGDIASCGRWPFRDLAVLAFDDEDLCRALCWVAGRWPRIVFRASRSVAAGG